MASRKSGCKVDSLKDWGYEITYFGSFAEISPSQNMIVRNFTDLEDLYYKIQKVVKGEKYGHAKEPQLEAEDTDSKADSVARGQKQVQKK